MTASTALEEAEDFLEKVTEVSILIDGLKSGTISPEYVDTKVERIKSDQTRKDINSEKNSVTTNSHNQNKNLKVEEKVESTIDQEERQRKFEELKANYLRKQKARQIFKEYAEKNSEQTAFTDYTKWDLWCPTDEEDDMINSCTPTAPEFRAMEKDINERHKRMVERSQIAERQRVQGNEAFKTLQYSEALRCYELGLESEKTNVTLHSNAAMAAIKLKCFVQAIEHCDKAFKILEFFEKRKDISTSIKLYQRRATAYEALKHYSSAISDIESALKLESDNKELKKQLERVKRDAEESKRVAQMKKVVSKENTNEEGPLNVKNLREVESIVQKIATAVPEVAMETSELKEMFGKLQELLKDDDSACIYFRECGGIKALTQRITNPNVQKEASKDSSLQTNALLLLNTACMNDGNLLELSRTGILPAVVSLLDDTTAGPAAITLLCTACTVEDVRTAVSSALASVEGVNKAKVLLSSPNDATKAITLATLGNVMVDAPMKKAVATSLQAGDHSLLSTLATLLRPPAPAMVSNRAAVVLGNMAGGAVLRALVASQEDVMQALVELALNAGKDGLDEDARQAALAGASALSNFTIESSVQELLSRSPDTLLQVMSMLKHKDQTLVSHSAVILSRTAKVASTRTFLQEPAKLSELLTLARSMLSTVTSPIAAGEGSTINAAAQSAKCVSTTLDCIVRIFAIVSGGGDTASVMPWLVSSGALDLLLQILRTSDMSENVLGNGALILGYIAQQPSMLPQLASRDAMAPLVNVAREGKGNTASRNAGVALARMAAEPSMLERLRELRGIEIMYQYVKP